MRYATTSGAGEPLGLGEALERGLGAGGALLVPERVPDAAGARPEGLGDLAAAAATVLAPFAEGDSLADELADVCSDALSFPIPAVPLAGGVEVLELFHGPTAAFKDVGARFLAACLARRPARERALLVATSGDTGGAVAAAFWRRPGVRVAVLFPRRGVAPRQRHQLTCWGDNVEAFAVDGTFDDCQRVLKQALRSPAWRERGATTANSVNVGRLLPQVAYFAVAASDYERRRGRAADFVVPSGNVGNATAALLAKRMGYPLGRVVLAHNANRAVPDFLATGAWRPRPSIATLANAMDVGDPSNVERVRWLYPDLDALRASAVAVSVDDAAIRCTIAAGPERHGRPWDPHTAVAVRAAEDLGLEHAILVATAHPAKFPEVVEPLVGGPVEVPPSLAELLARPTRERPLEPTLAALEAAFL